MATKTIERRHHEAGELKRFPEFPPREDMQNWRFMYRKSVTTTLMVHFEDDPNVIVANEVPVRPSMRYPRLGGYRVPDLMVLFDADGELMERQGGYEIDVQGKPPDFVLEVASATTGVEDYRDKRDDYERFRVFEYVRFDPTGGNYHDAPLAGDRLVGRRYKPIAVEPYGDGGYRLYSAALDLYLCWEDGELRFYDPETRSYLRTHAEDVARADRETARADRLEAELRSQAARAAREAARADREAARAAEHAIIAGLAAQSAAEQAAGATMLAADAAREAARANREAANAAAETARADKEAARANREAAKVAELEEELRRLRGD